MTALFVVLGIIAGILALVCLLLAMRVHITIQFITELEIYIRFGFIRFRYYPPTKKRKEKKQKQAVKRPKKQKEEFDIKEAVVLVRDIIKLVIDALCRYVKLEKYYLRVLVASPDAAATGLLYGAVSTVVAMIDTFVYGIERRSKRRDALCSKVECDFLAEKPELDCQLVVSIRLLYLLVLDVKLTEIIYPELKRPEQPERKEQ